MMAAMRLCLIVLVGLSLTAALLACQLPELAPPGPTSTPTASPSPTATHTPTATPTPQPDVLLEEADRALFLGDWSAAIDAYQRVRSQAETAEVRGSAQLGVGATHLRAGRNAEALSALTAYLNDFPEHPRRAEAHFLRAVAYQQLQDPAAALADYRAYLQAEPATLDPYVFEEIGDLLRQLARPAEAVDAYQAAISAEPLEGPLGLQIKMGLAYFEADQYEAALDQFDQVKAAAADAPTQATANLLAGRTLEQMGQPQAAYDRYLESVNQLPTAYDSYIGLIDLVEAGVPVDLFQRGLVDYYAGAYEPALRAFNRAEPENPSAELYYLRGLTLRALGNYPGAAADLSVVIGQYPGSARWADAWFERAITEWVYQGQLTNAIQTYLGFQRTAPDHPRAPEALYQAGRVAERLDELPQAADLWDMAVELYPESEYAYQSAFSAGIVRYRLNQFDLAAGAFEQAEILTDNLELASGARYWLGKTLQISGQPEAAQEAWRGAAERWLRQNFTVDGPEPLTELGPQLANDPRAIRGEAFWRLGLFGESKRQFNSLRASVADDAEATYRLMHKLLELGLYQPAIFAARNVLDLAGLDDAGTLDAPRYFNTIRFGAYYGDLIIPAAADENLDALLVLSVVRQESLFEGFATSYAAARGLMQVIPTTGQEIAGQLAWPPGYQTDDLYRPVVSVRFGTFYLAQQRDRFDGDLVPALAAYNAGPGNALAWEQLANGDPDLFVEVMRIQQPRDYVRSIYEIYKIYQRLYVTP